MTTTPLMTAGKVQLVSVGDFWRKKMDCYGGKEVAEPLRIDYVIAHIFAQNQIRF